MDYATYAAAARLGYPDIPVVLRRRNGAVFKTDSGNLIYDCAFGSIRNAEELSKSLSCVTGVVEHGLYVGIATTLVIARPGGVEIIERSG